MSSLSRRTALVLALLLPGFPGVVPGAGAQEATVRVQENFRMDPNGPVVAVLRPGTPLVLGRRRGEWVEGTVEGWVWDRSLRATTAGNFDLVVSVDGGENLRGSPRGDILGRLRPGTLLSEVGRQPGWIRVRRTAWIWSASLREGTATPAAEAPEAASDPAPPGDRPGVRRGPAILTTPRTGAAVLGAPDGDTLAVASAGVDLEVLAREGSWARVRVEGWTWSPAPVEETPSGAPDSAPPTRAAGDGPALPRGRVVTWELQFVSLERAERVRTDFYEGEPFLLTRVPGEGRFVYVAVPPDRMSLVEGLVPLESLVVTGRVRTGASALTGSPILDLVSVERSGGRPRGPP